MSSPQRPIIGEYSDPAEFAKDMIRYRKKTENAFSVLAATKNLRKVSPALVTLVLQKKRKLTLDRADEFSKLLALTPAEKNYLRNWLRAEDGSGAVSTPKAAPHSRKEAAASLLNDWINVYVKDFFQLEAVRKDPSLLPFQFGGVASRERVEKALAFLLREGYLRRTLGGEIVLETPLAVSQPKSPSKKVRQFHRRALELAGRAIELFPPSERFANTLIVPLTETSYDELTALIQEFAERLQDFASAQSGDGNRLYQVVINASPIGGKVE